MENYFNYLREMVLAFFENFARWMNTRWAVPWAAVPDDFARYGIIFDNFASGFGFWGWFFFVLFAIFFVAAIGALVFLIYWLLRKYIKFYRTEIDRERLREEVQNLQIELYNATQEKNRILGLQLDSLGISPSESISMGSSSGELPAEQTEGEEGEESAVPGEKDVRFPRLIAVDEKYAEISTHVELPADAQDISLQGIVERFRNYAASQLKLYYTIPAMRAFFASMGTGKIIILEGIHGLNPAISETLPADEIYRVFASALTCLNLDDHNRIRTTDVRLLRRIVRDNQFRGYPPEETLAIWPKVRSAEEKYIFTYQENADSMFNTALQYELPVLKLFAYDLLKEVSSDSPNYLLARRLIKTLNYLPDLDPEVLDEIPPLSLLREFIGGCTLEDA